MTIMNLTRKDITSAYNKIKRIARKSFDKKKYNDSLAKISIAAKLAYYINFIYTDVELENMLNDISKNIIPKPADFISVGNRYVFIDSFGNSKVLALQYLKALISWDVEILYILESYSKIEESKEIRELLNTYSRGTILVVDPELETAEKIKLIFNRISDYKPFKILLHITPWDVIATTVMYAFNNVTRYQINMTDHAFWLGSCCIDYTIEFRSYGCTVSLEKRNIDKNHILVQPFYPIIKNDVFQGFPVELNEDKVIIFSGGTYYKIFGENDLFFLILKRILEENPSAVILFAGMGNGRNRLENFISSNRLEKRMILLGERKDINEVFKNCDIYLNTYPFGGGLMSQYAAYNAKPILALTKANAFNNDLEDIVFSNSDKKQQICFTNVEDLLQETKRLVNDREYRVYKGQQLKEGIISPEQFSSNLYRLMDTGVNLFPIEKKSINFMAFQDWYLDIHNKYSNKIGYVIYVNFRMLAFLYFPRISFKYFPSLLKLIRNKIGI